MTQFELHSLNKRKLDLSFYPATTLLQPSPFVMKNYVINIKHFVFQ
ncbi:hypothetical protein SPPR111872_12770 [Sphingobacterium prati]